MDSSFGNAVGKLLATTFIVACLIAVAVGFGLAKGCDYISSHYSLKVEKKP
jgi:hypothetical protein